MATTRREPPLAISIAAASPDGDAERLVESVDRPGCTYEYDAEAGAHTLYYDGSECSVRPSTTLAEIVAELAGTDPTRLEPLYAKFDPDALDALVQQSSGSTGGDVAISFTVDGYEITVCSDTGRRGRSSERDR